MRASGLPHGTNRLELLVWVQARLPLSGEVTEHLERVSMAALVGIYPVVTWTKTTQREIMQKQRSHRDIR